MPTLNSSTLAGNLVPAMMAAAGDDEAPGVRLVPVDHNPFADEPAAGQAASTDQQRAMASGDQQVRFVPVDHDPFASGREDAKPTEEKKSGYWNNLTAGLNEGIYSVLGAPVDAATWLVNKGIHGINAVTGSELPDARPGIGGSQSIADAFGAVGVNDPKDVEAKNVGERLARGAGQGIGSTVAAAPVAAAIAAGTGPLSRALAPIAEAMVPSSTGQAVADAAIGGVSGATGSAAEEVAPEPLKPLANVAGNLVGGVAGAMAATAPRAVAAGARQAADYVAPLTQAGRERLAGETIRDAATNPQEALRALDGGVDEIVPGSTPTTFQQTGDMGLGALERGIAADRPDQFNQRRAEQNAARVELLGGVQDAGNPEAVVKVLRDGLADIDARSAAAVDEATTAARDATRRLGGAGNPEDYGASVREALVKARSEADAREAQLWNAVDPDQTLNLHVAETRKIARDVIKDMPKSARPMSAEEAAIFDTAAKYPQVQSFRELGALRSRVSTAMRDEYSLHGSSPVYARLTQLRAAIENDIDGAVAAKAEDQARAVASGEMSEDQTVAYNLTRWINGWLEEQAARAGSSFGSGPDGAGGAGGFPGARGSSRKGRGQFPDVEGFSGVQGNSGGAQRDALQPNFDEAAAGRLSVATDATRDNAAIYGTRPVADVLRQPAKNAPFNVPDASVAARFFHGGQTGYNDVQALRRAARDAGTMDQIRDYAVSTLRRAAEQTDGTLDPAKVTKWRAEHRQALRSFPEINRMLATPVRASETVAQLAALRKADIEAYQKGAFGRLLNLESPEDVTRTVGGIFCRQDATDTMGRLAQAVESNPDAKQGLRKSIVDYISNRFVGNTEAATSGTGTLKSDGFQTFVSQNKAALAKVFSEDEVKVLGDIAADLQRSNRSITSAKLPGGSNTAQDLASMRKAGQQQSLLSQLLAGGGGAATGATIGGPLGAVAGVVGAATINHFRNAGLRSIQDLVADAMLNPNRARYLLEKVTPTKARSPSRQREAGELYRQDLAAPSTAAERDAKPRPTDDEPPPSGGAPTPRPPAPADAPSPAHAPAAPEMPSATPSAEAVASGQPSTSGPVAEGASLDTILAPRGEPWGSNGAAKRGLQRLAEDPANFDLRPTGDGGKVAAVRKPTAEPFNVADARDVRVPDADGRGDAASGDLEASVSGRGQGGAGAARARGAGAEVAVPRLRERVSSASGATDNKAALITAKDGAPFASKGVAEMALKRRGENPDEFDLRPAGDGGKVIAVRKSAATEVAAHEAATSPRNDLPQPTQAQKQAGNYKLGHLSLGGLDISIENPQGSVRSGVAPDGKPWSAEMKHHYGYIRGTVGKDKDHVDVFVRPGTTKLDDKARVFVIDQKGPSGAFDEHKVMLGYGSAGEARRAYQANHSRGWDGILGVTKMPLSEFRAWVRDPRNTGKPASVFAREHPDGKRYYDHVVVESKSPSGIPGDSPDHTGPSIQPAEGPKGNISPSAPAFKSASDAERHLRGADYGSQIGKLLDAGRIVIHQDQASLPGSAHPEGRVQAMTTADGRVHLVASNLSQDTAQGVLLHEMFHAGAENMLGAQRYARLMQRVRTNLAAAEQRRFQMVKGNSEAFWQDALKRVDAAGVPASRRAEELAAYAIEHREAAPVGLRDAVDGIVGAVKEWALRTLGLQMGDVTPAQLHALARTILRAHGMKSASGPGASVRFSLKGYQPDDLVPSSTGSKDYGEIPAEVARAIGRQAAPIKLPAGNERYGLQHIDAKGSEITNEGFVDGRAFVESVARDYDSIYLGAGRRLMLVKRSVTPRHSLVVELNPTPDGDAYTVVTGGVRRHTYFREKQLLWGRAPTNQPPK